MLRALCRFPKDADRFGNRPDEAGMHRNEIDCILAHVLYAALWSCNEYEYSSVFIVVISMVSMTEGLGDSDLKVAVTPLSVAMIG